MFSLYFFVVQSSNKGTYFLLNSFALSLIFVSTLFALYVSSRNLFSNSSALLYFLASAISQSSTFAFTKGFAVGFQRAGSHALSSLSRSVRSCASVFSFEVLNTPIHSPPV